MDTLSLMVVSDHTKPVRRFEIRKLTVKRAIAGAAVAVLALFALSIDYVRMRIDNAELESLRAETIERRALVSDLETRMKGVDDRLGKLLELERKVRIIANLPGAAASGGEEVTAVGAEPETSPGGQGGLDEPVRLEGAGGGASLLPPISPDAAFPDRVNALGESAEYLGAVAEGRSESLEALLDSLEGKRDHLASSPSIWPTKGWLTSRYGYRVSPFTNKKQFHAGIDIAGAPGTPVLAPAKGRVVFAGRKGPLGNALIIDHGYGVRTQYGHNKELFVKKGQTIERGDKIATLGNSGRSTGPHLHYVVEVKGKTRNPLDYIFD